MTKRFVMRRVVAALSALALMLGLPLPNATAAAVSQTQDVFDGMEATDGWSMTSRDISNNEETEYNWAKNYSFASRSDGMEGSCVSVTRNAMGYVSLDSQFFAAQGSTLYMLEYALRTENTAYDTFYGVRAYLVQYDSQKSLLRSTQLHTAPRQDQAWTVYAYTAVSHPDTAYIQLQFWCGGVQDSRFTASFDNIRLAAADTDAGIWNFERADVSGGTVGWTASQREAVAGDTQSFYNGSRSVRVQQDLQSGSFTLTSNVHIPVQSATRYVFNLRVQSQNCDISAGGIRLDLLTYDENGELIETVQGLRSNLSSGTWSDWDKLICGLSANSKAVYVRPQLVVSAGVMDLRVDALSWYSYDGNDYFEDFENVTSENTVGDWDYVTEEGAPQFRADGNTLTLTGTAGAAGYASTVWYLNRQHTVYDLTLTYQASNTQNAFLRIRFYDHAHNELTDQQLIRTLKNTAMTAQTLQFVVPSAMYARIELGIEGAGMLSCDSIHISMVEQLGNENTSCSGETFTHVGETSAEFKDLNGTQTLYINGEPVPNMTYMLPFYQSFMNEQADSYMHDSGICVSRVETAVASNYSTDVWTGPNTYDFTSIDERIYNAIENHPDTYLMVQIYLEVPQWWKDQNPDELLVSSETDGKKDNVSFASGKFADDAIAANLAMLEHIKQQPYANRIVGAVLCACSTTEWVWYDLGQYALDYSKASQTAFREYLTRLYGTDAALQKAWNDPNVTLKTAEVPVLEDRISQQYTSLLTPEDNRGTLDYHDFMADVNVKLLKRLAAAVTEAVDDRWVLGAYYGYVTNTYYYGNANGTMHIAMEQALEDENLDFFCAPVLYNERYDGESGGYMKMIDSIQAHGKAVMVENDNRLCSYVELSTNFFTRDAVGPTYTVWDSVSQIRRDFANQLTTQVGQWWFNMWGNFFLNEQFSQLIGQMYDEVKVNMQRPSDYQSDICYIIDEDMYTYLAYNSFNANYDFTYPLLYEQRQELAKIGATYDMYYMSDLAKGLIPDYKVYMLLAPIEMDASERQAVETYLKNSGKTVIWQYISGASDRESFSAENMSDAIGMDVELISDTRVLQARFSDSGHALISGMEGRYYGSDSGRRVVSPVAVVTDSNATVLASMVDTAEGAFAIKDMGSWTSIYSAVPCIPAQVLRNILKMSGVHTYCDDPDSVIFASDKYVAINCAHGGEKTISLPENHSVYEVYTNTVISEDTASFTVDMEDHSTLLFRLMEHGTHAVFAEAGKGGRADASGYHEYSAGSTVSVTFTADKGYALSSVAVDGEELAVSGSSYTVTWENLSGSHTVSAEFKEETACPKQPELITSDAFNGGFEVLSENKPAGWSLTSMTSGSVIETANDWTRAYSLTAVSGLNGTAAALSKNGTGYAALTSTAVAATAAQGYRLSYSFKTAYLDGIVDTADFYGIHAAVECLDSSGDQLTNGWIILNNTNTGKGQTLTGQWQTVHHDFVPVAGTAAIRVYLCIGGKYYVNVSVLFDDVTVSAYPLDTIVNADFTGTINATVGGRGSAVDGPGGWNIMTTNSGGDWDSADEDTWINNYVVSTVTEENGNQVMKLAPLTTTKGYIVAYSHYIAVEAKTQYTLSYDQKIDLGESALNGAKVRFFYFDNNKNYLGGDWQRSSSEEHDWQRMENTVTTRANTAYMIVGFFIGGTWNTNAGLAYYYDDLLLQKHHTVTYVADGVTVAQYTVRDGEAVTSAPQVPQKSGYTGTWSHDGSNITADTEIQAVYRESISIEKWSLSLGDSIGVNFYVQMSETDAASTMVRTHVGGETQTPVLTKTQDGYMFRVDVAAAQMTDAIDVELTCGELMLQKQYSICAYAETVLNGAYGEATKALVREMLHYGAKAQQYFRYNTDKLIAEALYAGAGLQPIDAQAAPEMGVAGSVEGVKFYGATLLFESKTAVRYYFRVSGDITRYTFKAGDIQLQPAEKNDLWYVQISGITPQELDAPLTVSVSLAGQSLSVSYSPMNYIVRKGTGSASALTALLQAMYNYHLAAKNYTAIR